MSANRAGERVSAQTIDAPRASPVETARRYCIVMLFPGHMLTDHLQFGDGLVAFGFISALARRGHRVHVVAQDVALRTPFPSNVLIHSAPGTSGRGIMARAVFLLRSRAIVRRIMRTEAVDFVHQLNPVCNGMSLGLLGLNVPLVLGTFVGHWPPDDSAPKSIFGNARDLLRKALLDTVLRLQEAQAAAFLVTTRAALSRFSSPKRVADRVHWLPNGIDSSAFAPLAAGAGGDKTILFLASVEKKKGIFTLLDAFAIVHGRIPDAQLVIVGSGPEFADVERLVAAHSCSSAIRMLGRANRSAVPQLMADSAVYCLPSFGEPYGMTVIEAMACGKPIVVTDSGGAGELVDDAGGRRVEPGNVTQLADALIEIVGSPDLQRAMGAHNRATVERDYDWPRVTQTLEGIYEWVARRQAVR